MGVYVVTGASGHIGNTLVRMLLAAGHEVRAIVRSPRNAALEGQSATFCYGDVTDRDFVFSAIPSGSIVLHSAGMITITKRDKKAVFDTNVSGTRNVADACIANKAAKLVFVSSTDALTLPRGGGEITESAPVDPELLKSNYARSKAMATRYVLQKAAEGLDACVVYPSAVIGPGDYKVSNVGQVILDFMQNRAIARISGTYNFVDVRDVATGILAAAEKGRRGEDYILSGGELTVDELFAVLCRKNPGRSMPIKLPLWFVLLFADLGVLYYHVRGKKPVFSRYALKTLHSGHRFNCGKAERELGYTHRPAGESVGDTTDWFSEHSKP